MDCRDANRCPEMGERARMRGLATSGRLICAWPRYRPVAPAVARGSVVGEIDQKIRRLPPAVLRPRLGGGVNEGSGPVAITTSITTPAVRGGTR